MGSEEVKKDMDIGKWVSELAFDQWAAFPVSGPRPAARYKHAAVVVDDKLYVVGGSRNGRYLSDVQVLDINNLAWSSLKLKTDANSDKPEGSSLQESLPTTAGHALIKWGNKLLVVGGHSKKSFDTLAVWFIDLETHIWGLMEATGKAPVGRAGHSATVIGSKVIVFGGEDKNRKLLNDVHVLDLDTMAWSAVETMQTPPAPRFDHSAAVQAGRYLLVFGGCSHSVFFNDLCVLDLQSMEWSQPQVQGDLVSPRAGHAGVTIDDSWYIVGGGDNKNGCSETLVLDMSKLAWSVSTSVKERHPLASEGLSVCSTLINGEKHLVAFGGYNGKYTNEVFIMKPKLRDTSRPKIFQSPAAAAAAASVTAAYALAKSEKVEIPNIVDTTSKGTENHRSERDIAVEIDAIKEEKKALELSLAEVRVENSRLREKIDEVNNTHAELSKELHSVQSQLVAERSRCFKLEAQIAELQKMLESLQSIEEEVQVLRSQKSALEQDMEASVKRQGSGGVWRWIGGGNA